jgi:hypothetical protein
MPRPGQLRTDAEQCGGGLFRQIADGGIGHCDPPHIREEAFGADVVPDGSGCKKNGSQFDAETQEVLDFSAEHHVHPEIRIIDAESINDAFDDIADNDVAFRYVIDNSTLPASGN